MTPPPVGVVAELLGQVARRKARQPWGEFAVPLALQAMADDAGPLRSGVSAAQGDEFARVAEGIARAVRADAAPDGDGEQAAEQARP